MELHTPRRAGERQRTQALWLRFRGNGVELVLPVSDDQQLEELGDDGLGRLLDAAEPNRLDLVVWYYVSPYPEQDRDGRWTPRARIFVSNESEAWEDSVSDPEGARVTSYEEAASRSRMLGLAYVRRNFARSA